MTKIKKHPPIPRLLRQRGFFALRFLFPRGIHGGIIPIGNMREGCIVLQDVFLRYPGGLDRALTFSYDDGVQQDVRLLEIFNRHGLKATFNLNGGLFAPEGTVYPAGTVHRRMTEQEAVAAYACGEHEIGFHGLLHLYWEQLGPDQLLWEMVGDRHRLETLFHTMVRGGAYPFGTWNQRAVEALAACGAVYCRTVEGSHSLEIPDTWLSLSPTCHHADPALPELCDRFLREQVERKPLFFYIWGHSYEFEAQDNWDLAERMAQQLGCREQVYYATNIALFDYINAFRALRYNAEGTLMENPTATTVWFSHRGETQSIRPGERLTLPR